MNVNKITPAFAGIYVNNSGMSENAKKASSILEQNIEYTEEALELDRRGIDIFILPAPDYVKERKGKGARVLFADGQNRIFKVKSRDLLLRDICPKDMPSKQDEDGDMNFEKTIVAANAILSGNAQLSERPSRIITKEMPLRSSTLENRLYEKNPAINFDDENIASDEYQECDRLYKLYCMA